MRTSKERYRAVEVANPNLGGAGVEIENAFFVDLRSGIRRRNNFNTDIRGAPEDSGILCYFRSVRCEPGDINGLDAGGSGNRALGQGFTLQHWIWEERVR